MNLKLLLATNLSRKIIIISSLALLIFCSSSMAFASEVSPSQEQEPLEVDWPQLELKTSAGDVRAAAKTLDDVYNILNTGLMSGTTPKLDNIYSNISSNLEFWVGSQRYSIADLQGMTWQIANTISNQLSLTNSLISTTNAKLEYVFSAIEDTINIKWYASTFYYLGATTTRYSTNYLPVNSRSNDLYFVFSSSDYNTRPAVLRLFIPYIGGRNLTYPDLYIEGVYSSNAGGLAFDKDSYFLEYTVDGIYIYLFNFNHVYSDQPLYFHVISNSSYPFAITSGSVAPVYIPFDTLDYQIMKTAFNQAKSADSDKQSLDQLVQISAQLSSLAQSSQSGSDAAEALADYFVSPQKQAAEDASSQVINSTLNNFTGSGSGAAKSSDSNAMKDVSGSLQSGLNSGGSVSGATGVFNSGSDFWGWFSQQNSNYINNPYPAPSVTSTRGSGDEIVDFLTPNSNELQDLLRQGGEQR